jgi:hypothetical protein
MTLTVNFLSSSVYPGVRVSPFVYLTCNSYLYFETDYPSVSWPFLYNIISKLDQGENARFVFCDISKAFDMVLHKAFKIMIIMIFKFKYIMVLKLMLVTELRKLFTMGILLQVFVLRPGGMGGLH